MLILHLKVGEAVQIGNSITVRVLEYQDDIAQLGIEAPRAISVHREEIYPLFQEIKTVFQPDTSNKPQETYE